MQKSPNCVYREHLRALDRRFMRRLWEFVAVGARGLIEIMQKSALKIQHEFESEMGESRSFTSFCATLKPQ
jgi:hypothetical protein